MTVVAVSRGSPLEGAHLVRQKLRIFRIQQKAQLACCMTSIVTKSGLGLGVTIAKKQSTSSLSVFE